MTTLIHGHHAISEAFRHPLDPLNAAELNEAVQILSRAKHLAAHVRIASINLIEPSKAVIQAFQPGSPCERKALAVLLDRNKRVASEVVVDLPGNAVTAYTQLPAGVQPSILFDEFGECEEAVRRSPLFHAALA